jgi:hypothetical protein
MDYNTLLQIRKTIEERWYTKYPGVSIRWTMTKAIPPVDCMEVYHQGNRIALSSGNDLCKLISDAEKVTQEYCTCYDIRPVAEMDNKTHELIVNQTKIRWAALYPGIAMNFMVLESVPSQDQIMAYEGPIRITSHSGVDLNKIILAAEMDVVKYLKSKQTATCVSTSSNRG